jgi:predicted NUDIX family phosphoesterase
MSSVEAEQVLVVPASLLQRLGYFQGFTSDVSRYLDELLNPAHTSYRPRHEMEQNPDYKQLIPYVIFRHRDERVGECVFQYRRGKGQGEQRLHSKRSIGIGGHICIDDHAASDHVLTYQEGMRREINEEVSVASDYEQRLVGLINDDTTEVGRVHLGVVHLCDVVVPAVAPRERDILDAGFEPVHRLIESLDEFETWSQICLKALFHG